jgi:alkylhydroperoxidase family enzyme
MSRVIEAHGFTNRVLGWDAWLDVVELADASPEQITVLKESHPKAKESDYYLFLVHQPEILRQRSAAFNAIMYAPGGLSRAERDDVIEQVFNDPATAGTSPREKAIVLASIDLTLTPGQVEPAQLRALREVGLSDDEILDLIHSIAIFAWANRLMLNLGEPVG